MSKKIKQEETKSEKIKFKNGMFYNLQNNPSLTKFMRSTVLNSKVKMDIYRFIKRISESPEMKAYQDMIKEIQENHNKEQKDKDEPEALVLNHPKIMELHDLDSDFEIEKLNLKMKVLPEEITVEDLFQLSWIMDITIE